MKAKSILMTAFVGLLLCSCSSYEKIPYFQDADRVKGINISAVQEITLRPKDRISIVVNCKDPQLSALFNLPYVTQRVVATGARNTLFGEETGAVSGYTVDNEGNIDFPTIGKLNVAGLTRSELSTLIKDEIESRNQAKDPVITVDFLNLSFTVMGEVANPGIYRIYKDNITLIEAISSAGDLTIQGKRDNVLVMRMEEGKQKSYRINLTSLQNVVQSPVFYLQQDDIVYVEPNKMKVKQSTVNGNNVTSASFWISISSLATTVVALVLNNNKKKNKD
ncbi:MAG: polysaccharide export protein [Paludibacteraceae bacterium]|nr:polysaccharide export protein [Paludibacteraceae bacterium]